MASQLTFSWRHVEALNPPLARSSHDVSVVNETLFVLWGEHEARHPIPESDFVNTLSLLPSSSPPSWVTRPTSGSQPAPRLAHAQAVVGTTIFVFGGREGVAMGEGALNDFYALETETMAWKLIEPSGGGPVPEARSFHKLVGTDGGLYLFGGCAAEGRLNDFWFFDLRTSAWTQLPSPPCSPRGGPSIQVTSSNTHVFLATGYSGEENDDSYLYTVASGSWAVSVPKGSAAFRARSVCPSCLLRDEVFVLACGEVSTSDRGHEGAGDFAFDIVVLDREGKTVPFVMAENSDKISPRGWTAMGTMKDNSQAVLFGGLAGNDETPVRLNDTWILTIR